MHIANRGPELDTSDPGGLTALGRYIRASEAIAELIHYIPSCMSSSYQQFMLFLSIILLLYLLR